MLAVVSEAPSPARSIGSTALLALGVNGIVGVGIFFAPSELASLAGARGSVIVLAAVALALVPVAATFAALGRRFGEDGGPVTFARHAFGDEAAFAVGWLSYVSALFSTSAVASGLAHALVSPARATWASIALTVTLTAVVALGIDVSKRVWSAITLLKLAPLVLLAVLILVSTGRDVALPSPAPAALSFGRAALVACFAFQGFEVVPVVAGQAKSPARAVPIAILGSLAIAAALYLVLQWGFVTTATSLPVDAPLVHAGTILGGERMGALLRAGTSVSALGIAFGMMVTTPRYLSSTVPSSALGRFSARGVPLGALGVTAAAMVVVLAGSSLAELFTLSSLAVVLQYAMVAAALGKLAVTRSHGLAPAHLALAGVTLAIAAALLTVPDRKEWISLAVLVAAGALIRLKFGPSGPPRIPGS